ncbi:MAG: RES family NAD+ phosphorylase [Bacteroidales bacterium]|nr:RES family NAD+ phosphorylase [Bacteroidales bacterium]
MEVCPNCFLDKEIKGYIISSTNTGKCGVCNSTNVSLTPLIELLDFFQELIDNFRISKNGKPLKLKIQEDWNFFYSHNIANKILNEILPQLSTDINNAEVKVDYAEDIIESYMYWETLKEELKWSKRFISNIDYLEELGWDGFFDTQFELKPTDNLFRARVHHQSGLEAFNTNEMMSPKPQQVSGGRANPLGIPYLYLCDNPETVLYEVRASYLDELSVAMFQLKDEFTSIKIVDFTEDTPIFQPNHINKTIKASQLRKRISRDLSKPMRRYDTEIEYIPTQFICEYINVITGASGIRFSSSLHLVGKNIVIFDQTLMHCKEVKLRKVNSVDLKSIELK